MTKSDTKAQAGEVARPSTALPGIVAEVRVDGTGYLTVDGVREDVLGSDMSDVGSQITSRVAALAGKIGRPLPAEVRDPDGMWMLLVHPDGRVDEAPPPAPPATTPALPATTTAPTPAVPLPAVPAGASASRPAPVSQPFSGSQQVAPPLTASAPARPPVGDEPADEAAPVPGSPEVPAEPPDQESLGALLAPRRRVHQQAVATQGPRKVVRAMTFGALKPRPSEKERRVLAATEAVRRPLEGPRTVVVINPKGGAHKTTATLMLASTLGIHRGGYSLAWDNNETHGTLGWRSSAKAAGGTATDLLDALPRLLAAGEVRVGDLDPYVRTQTDEQFDVLASDEDAASGSFVDARSFAALHTVLTRFYRTIVVDTGNNIRSSNWRAAVEAADQLVIVTTIREDSAQAAAWAVDALRAAGLADSVRSGVTILSCPDRKVDKDLRERLRQHFGALTRTVVEVPYDDALVTGGPVDFARLRQSTREAWLLAAAAVVDGL